MSTFPAVTHIAVTVSDLDVSVPWYARLFGGDAVMDEDTGPFRHVVFAIGGGQLFGLHQFPDGDAAVEFSPRRAGLDHTAFSCADRAELQRWADRLAALGIKHDGIVDAHYGSGLSFKDPDGIPLEFFAPPA